MDMDTDRIKIEVHRIVSVSSPRALLEAGSS